MKNFEYAWLQISDLHIFDNTELNIMKKAYARLPHIDKVKFLVITGDLHQYKKDYTKTLEFLEFLVELLKIEKTDVFIVPGNHDSGKCDNKTAITFYIEQHIDQDQDCYKEYFDNNLKECFKEYNQFIHDFYGDKADLLYPCPEQVSVRTWNNKINIIHLNTAINCNGNNELKQIVDIYQLSNMYNTINKKNPSIMIAHHSFEDIHLSHQNTLRRNITDWKVSAYLCGDLHKEVYIPIHTYSDSGSNIPCLVCGKGTPENLDSYSDLGCIMYCKENNSQYVQVFPFVWENTKKAFEPYNAFRNDSGELKFELFLDEVVDKRTKTLKEKNNSLVEGESIWLPDAENATGIQARFETFASNSIINEFMQQNSKVWGVSAVKGVGKTYVLQIKSRQVMKDNKLVLPLGIKRTAKNNWGTDTIHLETGIDLSGLKKYENVVALWKYCIIVYVINQLCNIKSNISNQDNWVMSNPEKHLKESLHEAVGKNDISDNTYSLCTQDQYDNLGMIMKGVLRCKDWRNFIFDDLLFLELFKRRICEVLKWINKKSVVIMVDKIDQSVRQSSAEEPEECEVCKKRNKINTCTNSQKSHEYCSNEENQCRDSCCYGCEVYENPNGLRVRKHINIWQYLQIALLEAVSLIKTEFEEEIEVYFTIRQEAYASDKRLLEERTKKIINMTKELWYSKEEQRTIFNECIRHQRDELLYDASLIECDGQYENAFVGVDRLCHPYATHLTESVFDSIYRHSFDRARDIQEYGQMLTEHMHEIKNCTTVLERGEKVKELIEEKAARMAFIDAVEESVNNTSYYAEKRKLLQNYWGDEENFKRLLMMFDKNLMLGKEAKKICKRFNEIKKCNGNCKKCSATHHPFSMLYKLGLNKIATRWPAKAVA